jgi:hypothetical protein
VAYENVTRRPRPKQRDFDQAIEAADVKQDQQKAKPDDKLSGWRVAVEAWTWLDLIGSIVSIFGH